MLRRIFLAHWATSSPPSQRKAFDHSSDTRHKTQTSFKTESLLRSAIQRAPQALCFVAQKNSACNALKMEKHFDLFWPSLILEVVESSVIRRNLGV